MSGLAVEAPIRRATRWPMLNALLGIHACLERKSHCRAPLANIGEFEHAQSLRQRIHAPEALRFCEMLLHPTLNFEFEGHKCKLQAKMREESNKTTVSLLQRFRHCFDTIMSSVFRVSQIAACMMCQVGVC